MSLVGRLAPPHHSGPWAALWSHPCVAISSASGELSINSRLVSLLNTVCTRTLRQGINTLVLVPLRWPVLKCPLMAGFQMSTEDSDTPEAVDDRYSNFVGYT